MLQQNLIFIGFALIIIGLILVFASAFLGAKDSKTQTKAAFVGFIGPLPFGFGSDKQILYFALAIGIVMFILVLISNLFMRP